MKRRNGNICKFKIDLSFSLWIEDRSQVSNICIVSDVSKNVDCFMIMLLTLKQDLVKYKTKVI